MKIAIDVSQIVYRRGVSRYSLELVKHLLMEDATNNYLLFGVGLRSKRVFFDMLKDLEGTFNLKHIFLPLRAMEYFWHRVRFLPLEAIIGKCDLFHSSDWIQPPSRAFKVTTIHDLTPIMYPDTLDPEIVRVHLKRLYWIKKEVDHIIAVSNSTKADIIKYLGFPENRISVIYEAASPNIKKINLISANKILSKMRIKTPYILSIGSDGRKNTKIVGQIINQNIKLRDYRYIIVGKKTKYSPNNAIYLTSVNDVQLSALYSQASALVYASSYEGFGLPIVEAFSCCCPVVASDVSSMPEIGGDAVVLVNPKSTESITQGILKALNNRNLLIDKGIKRLNLFDWKLTAQKTLKVYQKSY